MSDDALPTRYDEERAALILDRAARLDAGRAREIDLAELRQAALEAGISAEAFRAAVAEVEAMEERAAAGPATPIEDDAPWPGGPAAGALGRRIGLATAGLGMGALPLLFDELLGLAPGVGLVFTAVLAIQLLGWLVWRHRREGSAVEFELDLTTLWLPLTFPLMFVDPGDAGPVALIMMLVWAVVAVVGGLLTRRKDDDQPPGGGALPPPR